MFGRTKRDLELEMLARVQRETYSPPKKGFTYWSYQEIDRLKYLRAQGKTFKQIAKHLGRTRASVAGFAWRHGIS